MRPKHLIASTIACLSIALMTGCGGAAPTGSQQKAAAAAKAAYFEHCEELPTPDSLIEATETSKSTVSDSSDGKMVREETRSYAIEADDPSEAVADYLGQLEDFDLSTKKASENTWRILSGNAVIATAELNAESGSLTITANPKSNRTTLTSISFGQPVETDNYTFTLSGVEWTNEIYPPDTSGYYTYYPEEANKTYCLIKGTFKYLGGTQFDFGNTSAQFSNMNGKYEFSASPEHAFDGGVGSSGLDWISNTYALEPLAEVPLYIYASIPDEVANDFEGGTFTWRFQDGAEYSLDF